MEAAGVAVGIIALIGTFKECIDLFAYFSIAKSLGRDYELLSTKLDVEKALLLQWAQRTNLLQPNYDRRLDDPGIRATVSQVVSSIRLLLSDTNTLQQRYGIRECQPDDEGSKFMFGIGANRMNTFTRDFGKLDQLLKEFEKRDLRIGGHRAASYTTKARWAVRDKDRFEQLLHELSYFVSRLHDLVPDTTNIIQVMTEDDVRCLSNRKAVRLLSEAASRREDLLAELAEAHHIQTCETRILRSLWYRLMNDREDALAPPNPQTFEWALDPSATDLKWSNIAHWLSHDSGIYWICGKAGSGKSTLMKYICLHPKTKEFLELWAGETSLTIASFFFWYLGTDLQKSQEGLSRALLYKILSSDRSLIPKLLPNMWTDAYNSDKDMSLPSTAELQQAFEKLGLISTPNHKFCIFVDGLDEYSGKSVDGANFLGKLARNPSIKIIVSSRPIQSCVQTFSRMPKLYLHDLTAGDVRIYIAQTIDTHSHMEILQCENPTQTNDLRHNLVRKACGVILWVVLACRSVREGLDNFDRLSDLRRRVDELPPELEQLFEHMIGSIERRYRAYAGKILRICHQSYLTPNTHKLSTLGLASVEDHDLDLSKLPSARTLAGNGRSLTLLDSQRQNNGRIAKCTILEGRLRSHCFGLVEVQKTDSSHNKDFVCDYPPVSREVCMVLGSTIEFLHRTVFDFLSARGSTDLEHHMEDGETFDPNTILACASLHLAGLSLYNNSGATHVTDALIHASNIGLDKCSQVESILVVLQELVVGNGLDTIDTRGHIRIYGTIEKRAAADVKASNLHLALFLAVELGLVSLLQRYEHMGHRSRLSDLSLHIPLLYRAIAYPLMKSTLVKPRWTAEARSRGQLEMVHYLISCGCSPNEQFWDSEWTETTPWKWLLNNYLDQTDREGRSSPTFPATIDVFIQGGADLDYGTAFFLSAQETAGAITHDQRRFPHAKWGDVPIEGGVKAYTHFLKRIADQKATTTSSSPPPGPTTPPLPHDGETALDLQSTDQQSQLLHRPKNWNTRTRSLSRSRLEWNQFRKFRD